MTSKKSISIDLSDPFAYEELPPEQYMLLDYLTEGPRAYLSEFLQRMFKQIDKRFPAELSNYKPHHIITEDSPIGRYFLDEKDDFMKECRRIYPEYTVRWTMPDYDGKNSISAFHFVYPHFPRENRTGKLQDLPAGMQDLKGFFRPGEKAYSAEDLTVMAKPAFRKKPSLLLNHYRDQYGTHTVVEGESLSKLCLKFYGDVKYWPSLLEINKDLIPDHNPKLLPIGASLYIPTLSEIEEKFKEVGPPPKQPKLVSLSSARRFLNPSKRPILDDWIASQKKSVKKLTYKEFANILEQHFAVNLGFVIIEKGDTLSTISELIYQDAGLWEVLQAMNLSEAKNEKALKIGSTLHLPALKVAQAIQKNLKHQKKSHQLQASMLKRYQDHLNKTLIQGEIATKKLDQQWAFLQNHYFTKGGLYQIQGEERLEDILRWICDDPKYLEFIQNTNNLLLKQGLKAGDKLQLPPIQMVLASFKPAAVPALGVQKDFDPKFFDRFYKIKLGSTEKLRIVAAKADMSQKLLSEKKYGYYLSTVRTTFAVRSGYYKKHPNETYAYVAKLVYDDAKYEAQLIGANLQAKHRNTEYLYIPSKQELDNPRKPYEKMDAVVTATLQGAVELLGGIAGSIGNFASIHIDQKEKATVIFGTCKTIESSGSLDFNQLDKILNETKIKPNASAGIEVTWFSGSSDWKGALVGEFRAHGASYIAPTFGPVGVGVGYDQIHSTDKNNHIVGHAGSVVVGTEGLEVHTRKGMGSAERITQKTYQLSDPKEESQFWTDVIVKLIAGSSDDTGRIETVLKNAVH